MLDPCFKYRLSEEKSSLKKCTVPVKWSSKHLTARLDVKFAGGVNTVRCQVTEPIDAGRLKPCSYRGAPTDENRESCLDGQFSSVFGHSDGVGTRVSWR